MKLKDSKTYLNLAKAYAGECQARTRYEFIEYGARYNGYGAIAEIIDKIVYNEFNHARMFYTAIQNADKEEIKNIGKILSGYFSFPIFLNSEHGGLHFYSHHLIEEMLTVFGKDAEYISTSLTKGKLVATAHYPEFPVIMNYAVAYPAFYGAVYGTKGSVTEKLSADGLDAVQIDLFIKAVQSGTAEDSCGNLLSAVRLSCAIERSIRENRAVKAEL